MAAEQPVKLREGLDASGIGDLPGLVADPGSTGFEGSGLLLLRAGSVTRSLRLICAAAGALVGGLVLLGWISGSTSLTTLFTYKASMKANAAIAALLASGALLLMPPRAGWRRWLGALVAVLVLVIGGATLTQDIFVRDLGIDRLLFQDSEGQRGPGAAGRMSPLTSANLILFGVGWLIIRSRFGGRRLGLLPAKLILISTLFAISGYIFDAQALYGIAYTTHMAPHTALVLALLAVGLLASRTDQGIVSLLVTENAGGALVRRLLPVAIVVPVLLAYLRLLGERAGLFGFELGLAALACTNVVVLVWLVGWTGASVGRYERARHLAEVALRRSHEDLETRVALRTQELARANDSLRLEIAERTRVAEELRAMSAFRRAMLEGAEYAIIAGGPDGIIREFNSGAERMLGYSAAEVIGKPLPPIHDPAEVVERARVLSAELGRFIEPGIDVFVTRCREGMPELNEWTYIRKDGSRLPVRLSLTALRGTGGEILGFLGIAYDITDIKRAQRDLIVARDSAEHAMRARSDFLARMSHEIRTPMNGILGMIDLALQTDLTPEQRDYLLTTQASAHRLLAIINDILDFSKIDAGKLRLESIPFRLPETIAAAVRPLRTVAQGKGIELLFEMAPDSPRGVRGDPHRLVQILTNLVGNAIKFTERGEVVVALAGRTLDGETCEVTVEVRDSGPGIPPDKQEVIFRAFSQVDEATTRTHGGTGLGLAICAQLIELMGGKIWVESTPGQGSRFFFRLRLSLDKEARPAAQSISPLGDTLALVAIDHPGQRAIVERMLRSWQIEVVGAEEKDALLVAQAARRQGTPFGLVVARASASGDAALGSQAGIRELMAPGARLVLLDDAESVAVQVPGWPASEQAHVPTPVLASTLLEAIQGTGSDAEAKPAPVETPPPSRALRILVAEDNPVNRKVIGRMLEKEGHQVEMAHDGGQAVAALTARSFDLVLMDVEMPVLDGLEATRAVRARGDRTPIVALTAQAMKGDEERCLAAGMSAYLTKPISRPDLLRTLAGLPGAAPPDRAPPPPSPSAPPEADDPTRIFDRVKLLERVDGDHELLVQLVELFEADGLALLEAAKAAAAAGDVGGVERAAHSLVGMLLNLSAPTAAERARSVETLARRKDLVRAAAGIGGLEHALRSLEGRLREEIRP